MGVCHLVHEIDSTSDDDENDKFVVSLCVLWCYFTLRIGTYVEASYWFTASVPQSLPGTRTHRSSLDDGFEGLKNVNVILLRSIYSRIFFLFFILNTYNPYKKKHNDCVCAIRCENWGLWVRSHQFMTLGLTLKKKNLSKYIDQQIS